MSRDIFTAALKDSECTLPSPVLLISFQVHIYIYNNNIFIETNDNKKIQIINQLHLENIIDNISL